MEVRDAEALEPRAHVAARRAGEEEDERGEAAGEPSATARRTSGPLIGFGSSPSPIPTPSFWNEPTTNAEAGRPSPPGRVAPSASRGRKTSMSIPIGIR